MAKDDYKFARGDAVASPWIPNRVPKKPLLALVGVLRLEEYQNMANYNEDEAAAAAVACIYLLAALCSLGNIRLTGFSLYIPLGIASLVRGVAFAAAASFAATHNPNYLAVRGALQAVGLGISVAMCACFLVIWLRNAALGSRPPPAAARLASLAARAAVACVIICGPLLGVTAVGLLYGGAGNPKLTKAGWDVRSASSAGFLAAAAVVVLLTGAVALHWLAAALRAKKQKQQQQPAAAGPAAGDGRIFVLLAAALLLLWTTISRQLAASSHPELAAARHLQYPVVVLPELAVAVLWAWPRLAARVALASRYDAWRSEQQQQRAARRQKQQQEKEGCADVEASVADGGSSLKAGRGTPGAGAAAVAAAEEAV